MEGLISTLGVGIVSAVIGFATKVVLIMRDFVDQAHAREAEAIKREQESRLKGVENTERALDILDTIVEDIASIKESVTRDSV